MFHFQLIHHFNESFFYFMITGKLYHPDIFLCPLNIINFNLEIKNKPIIKELYSNNFVLIAY